MEKEKLSELLISEDKSQITIPLEKKVTLNIAAPFSKELLSSTLQSKTNQE